MLLDVLLPQRCAACELPGPALCDGCRDSLIRLAPPLCGRCGAPGAWPVRRCAECSGRRLAFATARAAILYDEPRGGSCRPGRSVASDGSRARRLRSSPRRSPGRTWRRSRSCRPTRDRAIQRGHRPAESLARELGRVWELPVQRLVRQSPVGRAATWARAEGATAQRRRGIRAGTCCTGARVPRRRRLHERRHGGGCSVRAAARRRSESGGGDARTSRALRLHKNRGRPSASIRTVDARSLPWSQLPDGGARCDFRSRAETSRSANRSGRYAEEKLARLERQLPDPTADRGGALPGAQPVDRGRPRRRGDDPDEGPDAPREGVLPCVRVVDRPARGQDRAPGEALPREAEPARDCAAARTATTMRRTVTSPPSSWSG